MLRCVRWICKLIDGTTSANVDTTTPTSISTNTVINSKLKRYQLYGRGICRPLNMITISGGINSFDNNLITI